jgi:prefoldin subunit 5
MQAEALKSMQKRIGEIRQCLSQLERTIDEQDNHITTIEKILHSNEYETTEVPDQ